MKYLRVYKLAIDEIQNNFLLISLLNLCIYREKKSIDLTVIGISKYLGINFRTTKQLLTKSIDLQLVTAEYLPTDKLKESKTNEFIQLYRITDGFNQNAIYSYLLSFSKTKSTVSNSGLEKLTGIERKTISRIISKLTKAGLMKKPERNKNHYYIPFMQQPENIKQTVICEPFVKELSEADNQKLYYKKELIRNDFVDTNKLAEDCYKLFRDNISGFNKLIDIAKEKQNPQQFLIGYLKKHINNEQNNEMPIIQPPIADIDSEERLRNDMHFRLEAAIKDKQIRTEIVDLAIKYSITADELLQKAKSAKLQDKSQWIEILKILIKESK